MAVFKFKNYIFAAETKIYKNVRHRNTSQKNYSG